MYNDPTICHITSVHYRYDTRIFLKECASLAQHFPRVNLIVADGLGDEVKNNIRVIDVGPKPKNKLLRFIRTPLKIYRKVRELNPEIVHFHDPELLPYALLMRRRARVIYDAHEDFPKQVFSKSYIKRSWKPIISRFSEWFETFVAKRISGVIVALPKMKLRFRQLGVVTENINNYPRIGELASHSADAKKERAVAYVGIISDIRGSEFLIRALQICKVKLYLAGDYESDAFRNKLIQMEGWKYVEELGKISRSQMAAVLGKASAGIVTFLNLPNHYEAQPNKLFEYMSAGIPVISSNFPLWMSIVEGNNCGICVEPTSPEAIAQAITRIVSDVENAYHMGLNGLKAVHEHYNWEAERVKLISFYEKILSHNA